MSERAARPAIVALVAAAALWSFNGVLIKVLHGHGTGLPAVAIACLRSLIGGAVLVPWAWNRRRTLSAAPLAWRLGAVACFTAMTATFVFATTRTAAANAIVLQYTAPLWVFVLSPLLLRERARLREGIVLVIAMAGVVLIFRGNPSTDIPALVVGLASGVVFGALLMVLRRLRDVDPLAVTCVNMLGSGLALAALVPWQQLALTPRQVGLLLVLGAGQFALPYVLFSWAVRHVEAQTASLIVLLETVLNPLWAYWIVGEPVPAGTAVGGPLILAGVVACLWLGGRLDRRPAACIDTQPHNPQETTQ